MMLEILILILAFFFALLIAPILVLIAPEEIKSFNKYFWVSILISLVSLSISLILSEQKILVFSFILLILLVLIFTKRLFIKNKNFLSQKRLKIDSISSEEFINHIINKKIKTKKERLNLKKIFIAFFKLSYQIFI